MKKYTLFLSFLFTMAFVFSFNINVDSVSADCLINSTLRLGSRGADVVCLQTALNLTTDGKFGPMTRNAVIAWQASHSLTADGIFGFRSRSAWSNTQISAISVVSAPSSLQVGETGTWQIGINSTYTMARSSWYVIWGDEQVPPLPTSLVYVGANNTSGADDGAKFYHTYTRAGVYHPVFIIISQYGTTDRTTTTVNVGSTTSQVPVITGVSGPQTLNINQQGTWTVSAYDSNGGNLSYHVDWGEGNSNPNAGLPVNSLTQQTSTFTRSYSTAGTRTVTFEVTNSSGQSAQTTLSLNVGNTAVNQKTCTNAGMSVTVPNQSDYTCNMTVAHAFEGSAVALNVSYLQSGSNYYAGVTPSVSVAITKYLNQQDSSSSSGWTLVNSNYHIGGTIGSYYTGSGSGEILIIVPSKYVVIQVYSSNFSQTTLDSILNSIKL